MKYIKLFDTTTDMNAAIANTTVGFLGMAENNGNPVINNVPAPASNTITLYVLETGPYEYEYTSEINNMTADDFADMVIQEYQVTPEGSGQISVYVNGTKAGISEVLSMVVPGDTIEVLETWK
jgi:hypothetical protein